MTPANNHSKIRCFNCKGGETRTYRDGFKREVICDWGVGKTRLVPVFIESGFIIDHGYIKLQKEVDSYFCSLQCLDEWEPLDILAEGMSHYDKVGLLEQLEYEKGIKSCKDSESIFSFLERRKLTL